jgi:hypothetical protein
LYVGKTLETLNNKLSTSLDTEKILSEVNLLISYYNKFFTIEDIFTSELSGKTRINRQLFNENDELIQESIAKINLILDDYLVFIRQEMKNILAKYGEYEKSELTNLIFDDKNFVEILELNLDSKGIVGETKQRCLGDIGKLIEHKNKVFNLKYFIDMFDTSIFDRYINKLGVEDLINSTIIFEIIDSYGLQFRELNKFHQIVSNINYFTEKISDFNSLNFLLELHKRRVDNFTYANVRYKMFIDYDINASLVKPVHLNKVYLENILSCLIEQSCMDLVKKELKKGKIQKQIDVKISLNKGNLEMIVKNNGFEIKNIYNLFISDSENKHILDAKNFANVLGAKLEASSPENEGMQYTLTMKLK